jgi:hypothetical protein
MKVDELLEFHRLLADLKKAGLIETEVTRGSEATIQLRDANGRLLVATNEPKATLNHRV